MIPRSRGLRPPGPRPRSEAQIHATEAVPRVLRLLGTVVAPTTLVTALLFYFGLLHVTGMCRYLGLSYTVLNLSAEDYLVRSADGLFVPMAVAAGLLLIGVWSRALLGVTLPAPVRAELARRGGPPLVLAGAAAIGVAVVAVVHGPVSWASPELPGLCLAGGAVLMVSGSRLARRRPVSAAVVVAEWAGAFALVAIGLFWSVGNYAIGVGTTRGQQIEAGLASAPDAVLFSEKDLGLYGDGVVATRCGEPASLDGYRYTGLKLVMESADRLLLLPRTWSHGRGPAVVVVHADVASLTFAPPDAARPASC